MNCLSRFFVLFLAWTAASPIWAVQETKSTPSIADLAEARNWESLSQQIAAENPNRVAQADGTTALHWATHDGNLEMVKLLIKSDWKADAKNDYGISPLAIACENGEAAIAACLISAGAEIDQPVAGGESMLMIAARTGNLELVELLLKKGADVNHKEKKGQTALMWAAAEGNTKTVDLLIKNGADVHQRVRNGFDATLFAVRQGKLESVQRLLAAGVDVNAAINPKRTGRGPRPGTSAIMLAVENGHFELAIELVKLGADPNDQRSGVAPLHALSWVRKTKIGDNPEGDPAPRGSGRIHSLQFVREMVKLGADVNLRLKKGSAGFTRLSRKGATPFLMAAVTADLPLMKTLLELKANPHLANADDSTALLAASGINVSAVGEEPGTEPEVMAAIRWLVKLGLDPNHKDKNGETAMHGAAYHNYPKVVKLLSQLGANPQTWNSKNRWGVTPRMIAAGRRPGSFKPSPETIAAIDAALHADAASAKKTSAPN